MTKTRADLALRALRLVGAVAAGQPASAEDLALANEAIDPMLDDLARRSVISAVDDTAIPDGEFHWLAIVLASRIGPDFGTDVDPLVPERMLRALTAAADSGDPIKAVYY